MRTNFKFVFIGFAVLLLMLALLACSQKESSPTATMKPPKYYDDQTLSQYNELINQGYTYLDNGQTDSAVAAFTEMSTIIPDGILAEYNLACVYGRTGDNDKAFEWLNKLVDKGWDNPERLSQDTDLTPLIDDPRFDEIVAKAEANREANQAFMTDRLPDLKAAPKTFASEEEFFEWLKTENGKLRSHSTVWTGAQTVKAKIDLTATKLACLKELKKDDPSYEPALDRVKETARLKSPYECWGNASQAVVKEVDAYLAGNPSDSGISQANFYAGLALSLEYCDEGDANRNAALTKSNSYLDKVADNAELYGPALTLKLANNLDMAADKMTYRDEVRSLLPQYVGDPWVSRIVATRFQDDAIKMLWPIKINTDDIDNKKFKLADYEGKVLLIDFWATWCGPCRAELPNVLEVYKEYNDKGFDILSISLDYEDQVDLAAYREWTTEKGMSWRHIYDGKGWKADLVDDYFVSSIPAAFLIGKDGTVIASGDDCRGPNLKANVEKALAM